MDGEGRYLAGWTVDKRFNHIQRIDTNTLKKYEENGYAPRIMTSANDDDFFISAHEYLLKLMGQSENARYFRGFTVTPGPIPTYDWTSGSLNSPRDAYGELIQRIRGCQMNVDEREKIKAIISQWKAPVKELETKMPQTLFGKTTTVENNLQMPTPTQVTTPVKVETKKSQTSLFGKLKNLILGAPDKEPDEKKPTQTPK